MRLSPIRACVAIAALAGCGGGADLPHGPGDAGAKTLTCEWMAGPQNCWSNAALMAMTCLPRENVIGTFSADRSTCSHSDGHSVDFTPPPVLPPPFDPVWNFTVNGTGGQPCLHYEENAAGIELAVGSQTVNVIFQGLGMTVACPDGTSVHSPDALDLFSCPLGISVPGPDVLVSDFSLRFGLYGTTASSFQLFECLR